MLPKLTMLCLLPLCVAEELSEKLSEKRPGQHPNKHPDRHPEKRLRPPEHYESMWAYLPGKEAQKTVGVKGPRFSAYVYLEVPYDDAYDKRAIFAAYVQKKPISCPYPGACDGQKGGDEFDMIETGFVGFNSTWAVNDNRNCGSCGGEPCYGYGSPGCKLPGTMTCTVGDYQHCNGWTTKQDTPPQCSWTDAQGSVSFCTQATGLDARYQDNTKFSANGFLGGQTGKKFMYHCGAGAIVENDQEAYAVVTPDAQKWGNRWIKLDLELKANQAWYTWSFFQPGNVTNRSVAVAGVQSLMLQHVDGSWNTYNPGEHYVWVFSIWQYHFKSARVKTWLSGGTRRMHIRVLNPNAEAIEEFETGAGHLPFVAAVPSIGFAVALVAILGVLLSAVHCAQAVARASRRSLLLEAGEVVE